MPEQAWPDGSFPTCPYPNPEERAALEHGLALARETRADLLLGTDPDCDRMGAAVPDGEDYRLLTGNEMGVLLLDYLCRRLERKRHDARASRGGDDHRFHRHGGRGRRALRR